MGTLFPTSERCAAVKLIPGTKVVNINQSFHSAISPSNKPLQTRDKPLPPIPKGLNGALDRISHRRRDSIALPRVMGSFNRGMERVRRHSLVASELDHTKLILPATTNTMNSPLLTSSEVKPEISIEVNDVDSKEDYSKEEEAEIGIAIKMTIVSVRARLIYIGCKGLDS
ncbi:predicted protein [Sclerotinia sclerotiorum 1980 UF-70]|uniref:Uncharacterized protein n=1 Tax=Sclerotinia sclerotiorum (strain ATCC 18683 / 1980 / Ss-1) TaxID=665079 RepID=A7ENI2_SCLS1|nr:predicted protein [Sclerotinia sclerotiorum 1980 UF-70]EDO04398.1 predicted protein [Sclerotinia sclerotiorum 1980 UF-70]